MEISDPKNIQQIIEAVFLKTKVQLKQKDGSSILVSSIRYQNEKLFVKLSEPTKPEKERVLISNLGKIFLLTTNFESVDNSGIECLSPTLLKVISLENETGKQLLKHKFSLKDIHVSNIIGQNDVKKFLNDDEIKKIIKSNSFRLVHLFHKYKIFIHERHDERMRLMHHYEQPIFLPNFEDRTSVPDGFVPHFGFARVIDLDYLIADGILSEICIPIIYRKYTLIGYVQVQHQSVLDLNSFNLVSLVASSIRKEISDYTNFEESREICNVSHFNQSEITFTHTNNKHFTRIFATGEICILDLILPTGKLTIRIRVNKIEPSDKGFLVHCIYYNLSLKQLSIIEENLEHLDS
ncbi:MAG: hypothetical protein H7A24_07815 [Leptospiraceae bacterium]|nr:hypothetical protein [Leptospiraceae bacterium]MCP5511772.1 hypothetical protein [Leptospiraceae bacterium]